MSFPTYMQIYEKFDLPYREFERSQLGSNFAQELELVSKLWFKIGYRQGIGAYLNFFLLKDFIVTHDNSYPPRFKSFKPMADSFYQTDLFIREITDSGMNPSGGISSSKVRKQLAQIMKRHQSVKIPSWMMTYFGFSLLECVEKTYGAMTEEEKQLHLDYMAKTYRIMGIAFSNDRKAMEDFSRAIEEVHAGKSQNLEKHATNILFIGEMIGVSSDYNSISQMLPEKTRSIFKEIYGKVSPNLAKRLVARTLGKILIKQAVGKPRKPVPVNE